MEDSSSNLHADNMASDNVQVDSDNMQLESSLNNTASHNIASDTMVSDSLHVPSVPMASETMNGAQRKRKQICIKENLSGWKKHENSLKDLVPSVPMASETMNGAQRKEQNRGTNEKGGGAFPRVFFCVFRMAWTVKETFFDVLQ
ncbi:hypothetical protein TNIN_222381 [Trichonephila inaurata madagascariensis]|uniref:Uncharacterized protein n=1 Tax=Trichonephila inaurata madagascariensis TaxID=2747483 RepID=A0A8X6XIK9_9ARAC|nr:hypothetical protein TNIN_222381 [Trichonephila inaurata madagascariensis]